jgi:hypothetical protein
LKSEIDYSSETPYVEAGEDDILVAAQKTENDDALVRAAKHLLALYYFSHASLKPRLAAPRGCRIKTLS